MNFRDSLNAGLVAAKQARNNKDEIKSVLADLNDEINEFSNSSVSLKVTSETRLADNHNTFATAGLLASRTPFIQYYALTLVQNKKSNSLKRVIADWHQHEADGYPCTISYNKQQITCRSKEPLIKALNDLMAYALTGEYLLELMETDDDNNIRNP